MRYALAEDKLLAALMKHPDYAEKLSARIPPEQFVTDFNRGIYKVMLERLLSGKGIDMMSLSSELSIEQMSRLSHLLATTQQEAFAWDQTEQYADIVLEKQKKRSNEQVGSMSEEELRSYIEQIAAAKK